MLKMFALGSNGSGQLGIGHQDDVSKPEPCIFQDSDRVSQSSAPSDRVIRVVAGGNHTLVLTLSGLVYAAGSNEAGKCGFAMDITESSVFKRVTFHPQIVGKEDSSLCQSDIKNSGKKIKDIAATWEASFFITSRDEIIVCGRGLKGELGLSVGVTEALAPKSIPNPGVEISAIAACISHVVLLAQEGEVYGWGSSRKGQLGQDKVSDKIVWTPAQIREVPFSAAQIVVGRDFTFVLGSAQDQRKLLGNNRYISEAEKFCENYPTVEGSVEDHKVHASWSNIFAFNNGKLTGQGRNDRGQLPQDGLPELKNFAAGSEHCVAVTAAGGVVAWGWGEHGNCGPDTDVRGNVAGRWSSIPVELTKDWSVHGVAAGCATTFIVVGPESA